MLLIIRYLYVL